MGSHLQRGLLTVNHSYSIIFLTKPDFESANLNNKIKSDDIIFHFAGVNRDISDEAVLEKNEHINNILLEALEKQNFLVNYFFHHQFKRILIQNMGSLKKMQG